MKTANGPATGQPLGEDGLLLAGLGYTGQDKHTTRKNVSERTNLSRFLQESFRDAPVLKKGGLAPEHLLLLKDAADGMSPEALEAAIAEAEAELEAEAKQEGQESGQEQDVRRQDRREDARIQGQKESAEAQEARETSESAEAEQHQERQEERDEEDKPGAGWVAEENEDEADERKRGLRTYDVLDDVTRCRGHLDDGTRCLRKSLEGTPYCREHAAAWQPPQHS